MLNVSETKLRGSRIFGCNGVKCMRLGFLEGVNCYMKKAVYLSMKDEWSDKITKMWFLYYNIQVQQISNDCSSIQCIIQKQKKSS